MLAVFKSMKYTSLLNPIVAMTVPSLLKSEGETMGVEQNLHPPLIFPSLLVYRKVGQFLSVDINFSLAFEYIFRGRKKYYRVSKGAKEISSKLK